ncbi:MAG: hypothetical protein MK086_06415 [Flavobacteriales bacterium]|nr:hypothetical protein [Flavobacteriales bacterium]
MLTKRILLKSFILYSLFSCSSPNSSIERETVISNPTSKNEKQQTSSEPSPQQESAFDALNKLQFSTNEQNRLYSTFPGSAPLCFDKDTTVTISQSEFQKVLVGFTLNNCDILMASESEELASQAALAQEEYSLTICLNGEDKAFQDNLLSTRGTWILPNILGFRDLIIVW